MPEKEPSNRRIILFITIVSLICSVVLSLLNTLLEPKQMEAKELYRSKQMLIAARLLSYEDYFLLNGAPAEWTKGGLVPANSESLPEAKPSQILDLFQARVHARLTDDKGNLYTFDELKIDQTTYIQENQKLGYARLPYKLLYIIDAPDKQKIYGYVIPINGYGLWDAIYGFLALDADADTVLGTTWYDQKETPGLGAEIGSAAWQEQFYNKVIFQQNDQGQTNFERAPLGFKILKGSTVADMGDVPIAKSAIDGTTGATATMRGVSEGYRATLSAYRPFLIKANQRYESP
jgi:Na+-transporting NADH:ubiquinone oxidoreductase subunit C